jgi:hypothetical protein
MFISAVAFAVSALQACHSEKKAEERRSESGELLQEDSADNDTRRMQLSSRDYEATIGSNKYSIHITRVPDDNLPTVMSDMDVRYTDNRIQLDIKQGERSVVSRSFTKSDFASLLDDAFLKRAILSGMVFSKTEGGKIVLAASACYPQSDMCVPVVIRVSADGQIAMEKSEMLEDDLCASSLWPVRIFD